VRLFNVCHGQNPGADIRIDGIISGDVDHAICRLIGLAPSRLNKKAALNPGWLPGAAV